MDLEKNVRKSQEELSYLSDLMRDLEAAKNTVLVEIQNKRIEYHRSSKDREKQLMDREQEAANATRMEQWRNDRNRMRRELEAEYAGDLTKEEEQKLLADLQHKEEIARTLKIESDAQNEIMSTLENAFQRIRQATGVSTLDEMVEKFLGQESTKSTLEEERSRTEKCLNDLNVQKVSYLNDLNTMRAQGKTYIRVSFRSFSSLFHSCHLSISTLLIFVQNEMLLLLD